MLSFLSKKSTDKQLAVVFGEGRLDLIAVERRTDALPRVVMAESVQRGESDAATLLALRKPMKLDGYHCTALLAHGQYQMVQTEAPESSLPAAEARDSLRWKIKDMVNIPVEDAAIDFVPVPEGRTPQIFATIAGAAVMNEVVQNFQEAKLTLGIVDVPELTQRNLAALFEEDQRGMAMLVFDDREGLLTFTYGGELLVVRRIDITASQLASPDPDRRANLYERIGLDVQRSLDNFDRAYSQVPLSKVLVAPVPGAEGYVDYLQANLLLPVELMDLPSRVDLSAAPALLDPVRQARSLRALGAALRPRADQAGCAQINLYSERFLKHREWLTLPNVAIAGAASLLLVTLLAMWAGSEARARQSELATAGAELKALKAQFEIASKAAGERKPSAVLVADIAATEQLLQRRDEIARLLESGAIGNTGGFADYLRGLARQVPDGLWLTGFRIEAGGNEMEIRGRMLQPAALPEYIRRLGGESVFQGRSFASLTLDRPPEAPSQASTPAANPLVQSGAAGAISTVGPIGQIGPQPRYLEFVLTPRFADSKSEAKAEKGGQS